MSQYFKDYHDFVFRGGKLVAEFEDMYRHSEGVPWHQDEQATLVDVRLTVEMLRDIGPFKEIHDLGCGLGYYLALMQMHLGTGGSLAFGYDVSPTACSKGTNLFPQAQFRVLDLTLDSETVCRDASVTVRRLFMIRATLWYVAPHLANVVKRIRNLMTVGDSLLVVQNFPPLHSTFIGKDVLPDHHALIRRFADAFVVKRSLWYEDTSKTANDNWFVGLFSVRDDV